MCYGGYDPKYMLRDAQDRMKGVAFARDTSQIPQQAPVAGLLVRLWAVFRRNTRKDLTHG